MDLPAVSHCAVGEVVASVSVQVNILPSEKLKAKFLKSAVFEDCFPVPGLDSPSLCNKK